MRLAPYGVNGDGRPARVGSRTDARLSRSIALITIFCSERTFLCFKDSVLSKFVLDRQPYYQNNYLIICC